VRVWCILFYMKNVHNKVLNLIKDKSGCCVELINGYKKIIWYPKLKSRVSKQPFAGRHFKKIKQYIFVRVLKGDVLLKEDVFSYPSDTHKAIDFFLEDIEIEDIKEL